MTGLSKMATTSFDLESLPDPEDQGQDQDEADAFSYARLAKAMTTADFSGLERRALSALPRAIGKSAALGAMYGGSIWNIPKDPLLYDTKAELWSEGLTRFFGARAARKMPFISAKEREQLYARYKHYARARSGRHRRKAQALMGWLVAERMTRDVDEPQRLQFSGTSAGRWEGLFTQEYLQGAQRILRSSGLFGEQAHTLVVDEVSAIKELTPERLKAAKEAVLKAMKDKS